VDDDFSPDFSGDFFSPDFSDDFCSPDFSGDFSVDAGAVVEDFSDSIAFFRDSEG